ncbi:hypothetical protein JHK85_001634 [Glycine max]|nr:hypothetical protein JHK85_001634 [Glycine max]
MKVNHRMSAKKSYHNQNMRARGMREGERRHNGVREDAKIGATLWQELFPEFEAKLHCGSTYVIQNIKVVENHSEYKVSRIPFLVYLVKITSVKEAKCPEIPPNVNVITRFANIIAGVAPRDTLMIMTVWEEYALQLDDAIEKNHFDRKLLVVMLTLAKIKDPKGHYHGSGDEIKVFPPCVDELLGKTWVVMFKYHVRMRQSSVLHVTKDEDRIQTMTSTIGLQDEPSIGKGKVVAAETSSQDYHPMPSLSQPADYDPGLSVFVTPAKRMSISKPVVNSSLTNTHRSNMTFNDHLNCSSLVSNGKTHVYENILIFMAMGLKEFRKVLNIQEGITITYAAPERD